MRIDINTQPSNGPEKAVGTANTPPAAARVTSEAEAGTDTAKFLFDRIRTHALAPEPPRQIEAGKQKVEALQKILSDGSYDVPPELIAGALISQAKIVRA